MVSVSFDGIKAKLDGPICVLFCEIRFHYVIGTSNILCSFMWASVKVNKLPNILPITVIDLSTFAAIQLKVHINFTLLFVTEIQSTQLNLKPVFMNAARNCYERI